MRKKGGFFARLLEKLDLPCEALPGGFGVLLSGKRELSVGGCREILKCDQDEILLALCGLLLAVRGSGLLCTAFDAGTVSVTGDITQLQLYGEGEYAL